MQWFTKSDSFSYVLYFEHSLNKERMFAHAENMDYTVAKTATARLMLAKTHMVFNSGDEVILDRKRYDCQNRIWILYI